MIITYDNTYNLLKDWKLDINIDPLDIDYLASFLIDNEVYVDISLIDLAALYNRFSEEAWFASWEDNAEGQFIEWLKENYL